MPMAGRSPSRQRFSADATRPRDRVVGRADVDRPAHVRLVRIRPHVVDARHRALLRRDQPGDPHRRRHPSPHHRPGRGTVTGARSPRLAGRVAACLRAAQRAGLPASVTNRFEPGPVDVALVLQSGALVRVDQGSTMLAGRSSLSQRPNRRYRRPGLCSEAEESGHSTYPRVVRGGSLASSSTRLAIGRRCLSAITDNTFATVCRSGWHRGSITRRSVLSIGMTLRCPLCDRCELPAGHGASDNSRVGRADDPGRPSNSASSCARR